MPPRTIKRTTNLKINNNYNCWKIELYGSPTTKELKKKHSFTLVGGVETIYSKSSAGEPGRQGSAGVWINWEEQLGSETDHATQGSSLGKESLKTPGCKNLWGLRQWEKLPISQERLLERPTAS